MYSFSIDYLFNRIYDVLLWIKYTWFFSVLRKNPETYLDEHAGRDWDGLRDRGWFDDYFAQKEMMVPQADTDSTLWQKILEAFGLKVVDSDNDGIPDVTDSRPYDADNLTKADLKERYESDYSFMDHVRDMFGVGPKDTDKDGVPDSYEMKYNLDPKNPDSDRDGVLDGQEVVQGTNPLNNDTDGDMVLDGRDEAPLDIETSSIGPDADEDGVSDRIEKFLGTDSSKLDTDGDGISDSMDTYPLDPENLSQIPALDINRVTEGVNLSIQNPVLSVFVDILSVLVIAVLVLLVYLIFRWFLTFVKGLDLYEHHFHHGDDQGKSHGGHVIKDSDSSHNTTMPGGIAGLPVGENIDTAVIVKPSMQEISDHPKFAVIQGYMSSGSEALWRIGIMEADNLLLEILAEKGYSGEGVGEKLKDASFKTIDLAWDAHKTRNRIAHEGSDFELTEREAKRTFMLFESVFRDLKAIR